MKPRFDHKVIRPNGYWVRSESTDVSKTIKREQDRLKKQREAMEHKLISIQRVKRNG